MRACDLRAHSPRDKSIITVPPPPPAASRHRSCLLCTYRLYTCMIHLYIPSNYSKLNTWRYFLVPGGSLLFPTPYFSKIDFSLTFLYIVCSIVYMRWECLRSDHQKGFKSWDHKPQTTTSKKSGEGRRWRGQGIPFTASRYSSWKKSVAPPHKTQTRGSIMY